MTAVAVAVVCSGLFAGAGAAAAGTRSATAQPASGGSWGTAQEVPGTAALNTGGFAEITSVSCRSAGNCSAGGFYAQPPPSSEQAFVVDETDGTWGTAQTVAGALNTGGDARIDSVSCGSPGNCAAGGQYTGSSGTQAFVIDETDGTWGAPTTVAAAVNHGFARTSSVSCASPGNCSAGGTYRGAGSGDHYRAFVVSESNGVWGATRKVAAGLNAGQEAEVKSVSCAAVGACSAAGFYTDASGNVLVFAVGETGGIWGTAQKVRGIPIFTGQTQEANVDSVSCGAPGDCTAGGSYSPSSKSGRNQAFIVSEKNGAWGPAKQVAAALSTGGYANVESVSCPTAGNCAAVGWASKASGYQQGFAVSQTNGTWGTAAKLAGTRATSKLGNGIVYSVSCASAGNCSAGGQVGARYYTRAFVIDSTDGIWGTAQQVPGLAALNVGKSAAVYSVSCATAGNCGAGGEYKSGPPNVDQAFIVSQTSGAG